MPGFLVHVGATVMCPHGGQVTPIPSNTRVFVSSQLVVTLSDLYTVIGCSNVPPPPGPCIKVQWIVPALRVLVNGQPVILQDSVGICQNLAQVPQGAPVIVQTQMRVKGI